MPELPEVETVRRGLERLVVGKRIQKVEITYPRMVVTGAEDLRENLKNQKIKAIQRRGKYLLFYLEDWVLLSHLRMEGKYHFFPDQIPINKHFYAFFSFDDGTNLVYQDVRKFGTMELLKEVDLEAYFDRKKLGPEPVAESFDLSVFQEKLSKSKKSLKPHLLDQSLVAGLGNIYVDEVLWRAELHPVRRSSSLTKEESITLHQQIIAVMQLGIEKGGSTIRTYKNALGMDGSMQDYLQVYGQKDQPCPRCQTEIVKIQLLGRGTHFCPHCQEEK